MVLNQFKSTLFVVYEVSTKHDGPVYRRSERVDTKNCSLLWKKGCNESCNRQNHDKTVDIYEGILKRLLCNCDTDFVTRICRP